MSRWPELRSPRLHWRSSPWFVEVAGESLLPCQTIHEPLWHDPQHMQLRTPRYFPCSSAKSMVRPQVRVFDHHKGTIAYQYFTCGKSSVNLGRGSPKWLHICWTRLRTPGFFAVPPVTNICGFFVPETASASSHCSAAFNGACITS